MTHYTSMVFLDRKIVFEAFIVKDYLVVVLFLFIDKCSIHLAIYEVDLVHVPLLTFRTAVFSFR